MLDTLTHFIAHCPSCSSGLKIRRVYLGQQVRCKQCDEVFVAAEGQDGAGDAPDAIQPWHGAPATPRPERLVVNCPSCRAALSVRRAYIGREVRCKQCDEAFLVADPDRNPLAEPANHHDPAENGREVHLQELDRLRGEHQRIAEENLRLQAAHDELLTAQGELLSAHRELQAAHDQLRTAHGELQAAHGGLQADYSQLEAAHGRLQESDSELQTAHDQVTSEIAELKAAHERITGENERLVGDRDRLQAERDGVQAERDRNRVEREELNLAVLELRAELAEIRAEDREVQVEWDRLRTAEERLLAERDRLEVDLKMIVEALGDIAPGEVRPMAEQRAWLSSEVEQWRGEAERLQVELEAVRDERSALERAGVERERRSEADLMAARGESDRLATLVCDREAELERARIDRDRLNAAREDASAETERLRAALDQIEGDHQDQAQRHGAESDRFRAEVDQYRAESDRLKAESDRLRIEADRRRTESDRLRTEVDRLWAEAEQQRAESELLHDARTGAAVVVSSPERDEELRAAHARVESLQRELADLKRLEREMRGILGGIGIRFREI